MTIHLPLGFRFAGLHAGIKKNPQKEDLTLVHCPAGAVAAGLWILRSELPQNMRRRRTPVEKPAKPTAKMEP
jgi:N-acetylglutamate synthase/N-acetylornithine aminotransferase